MTETPPTAVMPLVAVCQGHRCRALLARSDTHGNDGMDVLRDAARNSTCGVLVSTECAGPCTHGPVAAVGTGVHVDGQYRLVTRALVGPLEAQHVAALAGYLQSEQPLGAPAALHDVLLAPHAP